nr:hypothetical protein [Mycoplasmopsis bovis]
MKIMLAQYSLLKYGDEDAIEKKLDETRKTIIKRQVKESSSKSKWDKITNVVLIKALESHKIDDSKTLTEVLKSYADRVLALVKEFYEKAKVINLIQYMINLRKNILMT